MLIYDDSGNPADEPYLLKCDGKAKRKSNGPEYSFGWFAFQIPVRIILSW